MWLRKGYPPTPYILFITSATKAWEPFTISFKGDLKEDISAGAKVAYQVKYLGFTAYKGTSDLCEQSVTYGQPCPIKAGTQNLTQVLEIPKMTPPVIIHCHITFNAFIYMFTVGNILF
jgi:hypothetical protein